MRRLQLFVGLVAWLGLSIGCGEAAQTTSAATSAAHATVEWKNGTHGYVQADGCQVTVDDIGMAFFVPGGGRKASEFNGVSLRGYVPVNVWISNEGPQTYADDVYACLKMYNDEGTALPPDRDIATQVDNPRALLSPQVVVKPKKNSNGWVFFPLDGASPPQTDAKIKFSYTPDGGKGDTTYVWWSVLE